MSVISRLILVDPKPVVEAALRFGFEREGTAVTTAAAGAVKDEDAQVIIVSAPESADGVSVLEEVRRAAKETPVLYVGNGITRDAALAAGATDVLGEPAYLRDVVTTVKVLASPKRGARGTSAGELSDHYGLYYLVRAIQSLGRSAVLTLVRGLRRGELRFFEGEITSAQVGMLHGLPALHQLMLWTDARFELRPEAVVRRGQIPLPPGDVLRDVEHFLEELRAVAGGLSPSQVYEQDAEVLSKSSAAFPKEIQDVLRMFDGIRVLADVVEDSPYRVLEILRIAAKFAELGLIKRTSSPKPQQSSRAALAMEEWLVGAAPAPSASAAEEADWTSLLPGSSAAFLEAYAQVVESASAVGEIESPSSVVQPAVEVSAITVDAELLEPAPIVDAASDAVTRPVSPTAGDEATKRESSPSVVDDQSAAAPALAATNEGKKKAKKKKKKAKKESKAEAKSEPEAKSKPEAKPAEDSPRRRLPTSDGVPQPVAGAISGEIEAPPALAGHAETEAPSIVVDGIESVTEDAREAIGRATAAARIADIDRLSRYDEPTSPGKRVPGYGGLPFSDDVDPDELVAAAKELDAPDERDLVNSDLSEKVVKVAEEASIAADAAAFSDDEEAFFAAGSKIDKSKAPKAESFDDLDEEYEVPSGFWQRFWSDPNRSPKKKKK